jgi:hypothetical protein
MWIVGCPVEDVHELAITAPRAASRPADPHGRDDTPNVPDGPAARTSSVPIRYRPVDTRERHEADDTRRP